MDDEVELISDGNGLAIVGETSAVERFMTSSGLASIQDSRALTSIVHGAAAAATAGAELAADSGRWVQLTEESAQAVKRFGLMDTNTPGVKHAMVGRPGEIKEWIQIARSPTSLATNPAVLTGAAGMMAQLAMKQQMEAITDYLETIDAKLDDVLRSQRNQVLAKIDGVELSLSEAMKLRESTGRVSDVTWSKVQQQSTAILETQAYAVRQLGDLADKLEREKKVGGLAKVAKEAETEVEMWFGVLARCLKLHDGVGILELDRVMDGDPDEVDRHRIGLETARTDREKLLSACADHLLTRMEAAVETANSKVLFNPTSSPSVVRSRNCVVEDVHEFNKILGIESGADSSEARRWKEAANESLEVARSTGAQGLEVARSAGAQGLGEAKRVGGATRDRVRSARDKLTDGVGERKLRWRRNDDSAE